MASDWYAKEFHMRNEKEVELESAFFAEKFFRSNSQRNVTAYACIVFCSSFSKFAELVLTGFDL